MNGVTGIGGVFFRARDPSALGRWYGEHLGIAVMNGTTEEGAPWWQESGPTVFAPFDSETDYFGRRDQQWMLNFRVSDLDAILQRLRAGGASVDPEVQVMEGIGRFGWATDPEGNRFELWEPAPQTLDRGVADSG